MMKFKKAIYSADDVAKEVIRYSHEKDYDISNLKLQKILYFIQAIFLNESERACFSDDIEAWTLGPVIPYVYHKYKIFGANNIPLRACRNNNFSSIFAPTPVYKSQSELSYSDKNDIDLIVDFLSKYTATELVNITHGQDPWIDAYAPHMNNIISKESIYIFFNKLTETENA